MYECVVPLQTLDVAYGESHPRLARDTDGPIDGFCAKSFRHGSVFSSTKPTPR